MQGIIRSARRPANWVAPGPAPRGALYDPSLQPAAGEDLCYLSGDWRIFQLVDGHRWSIDDLLTAWVATRALPAAPSRILDIGCGIGSVLLMLAWRFPTASVLGVEAQAVSVELARRSLRWNGADDRCAVRHGDLRDATVLSDIEVFDLITGTPPYFPPGSAIESQRPQWAECHIEHRGGVEAYCMTASRHLAAGGRFVICAAASDGTRMANAAALARLAIVRRMDVIPRAGKAALFAVYVLQVADGAPTPTIEPPLVVRDAAGRRTDVFVQIRHDMGMPP